MVEAATKVITIIATVTTTDLVQGITKVATTGNKVIMVVEVVTVVTITTAITKTTTTTIIITAEGGDIDE